MGFDKIWTSKSPFEYSFTKDGNYKVILKNQHYLNFVSSDGFSLFLPNYLKEYSLKIIRQNSIGEINGYLSIYPYLRKNRIIKTNISDLKYYETDYKSNYKALDKILKGFVIPYKNQVSLSFEGYNIPHFKKLNKNLYFIFVNKHLKTNKLRNLLYSYYMVFYKKDIDRFVYKNYAYRGYSKDRFAKIKLFIENMGKIKQYSNYKNINMLLVPIKKVKSNKKEVIRKRIVKKKKTFILPHKKRLLYMKDFGYIYQRVKEDKIPKIKVKISDNDLDKLQLYMKNNILEKLYKLNQLIRNDLSKTFVVSPKDLVIKYNDKIYNIIDSLNNLKWQISDLKYKLNQNIDIQKVENSHKCIFNPYKINKDCFNNQLYYHNYIYFSIKKDKLPSFIKPNAIGKTYNDIAKYYFEKGDLNNSKKYLDIAYKKVLSEDEKKLIAHNIAVWYATRNTKEFVKKSIKFFKEAGFDIDYYNLGVFSYLGFGMKEDNKKAIEYFKKSNIPYAKDNLNVLLHKK